MSIRLCRRVANSNERGFVLVSVLVLALLYFGLLELMLIESSEAMRGARRFRTRVTAHALAENAAELAAHELLFTNGRDVEQSNHDGTMKGKSRRLSGERFEIEGVGIVDGSWPLISSVKILGHFDGAAVFIDRTTHSQ